MKALTVVLASVFAIQSIAAQKSLSSTQIKDLITSYKNDIRGPYYRIKWFCEDGTVRDPKDPCPDGIDGIQHATFKESALSLRKTNGLYFGEILASNDKYEFLDEKKNFDRLKQYQINKYLASVDDGWVLRRGQFYRGAIQSEDEEVWGREFFETILKDKHFVENNYYLIKQALKDIPHNGDSNIAQLMRSQSKTISEDYSPFMDLRIKIHGQPEASDVAKVEAFFEKHRSKISNALKDDFLDLIGTMKTNYASLDLSKFKAEIDKLPKSNDVTSHLLDFVKTNTDSEVEVIIPNITEALNAIREGVLSFSSARDRLTVLDISNDLEHYLLTKTQEWKPANLDQGLHKILTLVCAAKGTGLIEEWEYNAIEITLNDIYSSEDLTVEKLSDFLNIARSVVEWSAAMAKANYIDVVENYTVFEPLAYGFIDDKVRSSVALSLGESVSKLGDFFASITNLNNDVLGISNSSSFRGLNPGYAFGKLVVVDGNPDEIEVDSKKIYIFERPPHDLKPVAGIMTVSEGNLVSHVQLLARNLGIPNAALSYDNLKALMKHNGKEVFYAVSNRGNLILKTADKMSEAEKELFAKKERSKAIVEVPTDQIQLNETSVVNMRNVDANDSGKFCGPKAANLGELKKAFPNNVVEGLVIPFGIFRAHMDQPMPEESKSYWEYLNDTFKTAKSKKQQGIIDSEVEAFQLAALEKLHKAITNIPLKAEFTSDLELQFTSIFGKSIGNVPVFLRSDTNMEDLKEFTGAGLNLTLFNILDKNEILNGIKRVWASAYTERSFKWRQKYLSNPENVFPSILIIPSVDVDYSGVMITKGINSGNDNDLTVAFSRGAGGAVDGQLAETRLITQSSNSVLAPARQPDYIRLPQNGGTKRYYTGFKSPILNSKNIEDIRSIAKRIRSERKPESESISQAYDVEFGFKNNKLWLFQIRPFVENKTAKSSAYLASISPKVDSGKIINRKSKLDL
ncbi:PEP/pyruvate-binding domain-containing protein [Winogradskyella luteola]|uniref:Phosphoenolpyruvate synthase n=1 Tax=Winogradskyella luteola TaxID=2828330 RepID=A0A9X1F5T8_9FLAO|nr:PEP/pyruvate-binding domain-containing protein [Winogradskyella luteola]MBV7267619.1 phosphoenolpyruvate synthase [Winogradskyella luteola]